MPGRPLLTFDMDGVLCRQPFGINPGSGRGKRRDTRPRWTPLWATERWRYAFRRPMPGAVEDFRALAERYDCRVLSARGEAARGAVERWFARHFGVVPQVYLRPTWRESPAQFKTRTAHELGAIAHFEDDAHTAAWMAELLPAVFIVDWPRNRWLEGANVHRIRRIGEALPVLERLEGRPPAARYAI